MPIRILIVEDHEPTRELIREYLARDARLTVVAETPDGKEAVALAKEHHPDLVLMDLVLRNVEEMSGLQATRLIKKACPTTEVIILTNVDAEEMRQGVHETTPAWAFLGKGEIPTRLLWVISDLIKARGGERRSHNR